MPSHERSIRSNIHGRTEPLRGACQLPVKKTGKDCGWSRSHLDNPLSGAPAVQRDAPETGSDVGLEDPLAGDSRAHDVEGVRMYLIAGWPPTDQNLQPRNIPHQTWTADSLGRWRP